MIIGLTALAACIPFFASIIVALKPSARPKDEKDYFLYGRSLDAGSFVTSNVGYSTQVASIFLFLYWFFTYGLGSLFVPFAWGAGYLFVAWLAKTKRLDTFLVESTAIETLHGYIGRAFSKDHSMISVKILVIVASLSTLIGLGGSLVTEVDYATRFFLLPGISLPSDLATPFFPIVSQLFVLSFSGCYILWGGYKAAIMTDQIQIRFAYISFVLLTLFLAVKAIYSPHTLVTVFCTLILLFILWDFSRRRRKLKLMDPRYEDYDGDHWMFRILITATISVFIYQLYLIVVQGHVLKYDPSILPPSNNQFFGFGVVGVISLGVTNFFWQLIDLSCLQRLQSVQFDQDDDTSRKRIVEGLKISGFESFGVWLLTIVFAVLVKALGGDYASVPKLLMESGEFNWLIMPLMAFFVVSFMISTIDCFISASAFVAYYDLAEGHKHHDLVEHRMFIPRLVTLGFILLSFLAYWLLVAKVDPETVPLVLYGFYAIQASIFIVVLMAVFSPKRAEPTAGWIAILCGWAAGFFTAVRTPICGMSSDSWGVFPPLASVAASFLAYGIVFTILRLRHKIAQKSVQ